jgi:AraC-like DNA-binding protein
MVERSHYWLDRTEILWTRFRMFCRCSNHALTCPVVSTWAEIGQIQFPQKKGIKCYAVVSGACWLSVEDVPEAVHLQAGDCFLLPTGRPLRLASDLALAPIDASALYSAGRKGGIVSFNGGGSCFIVGGHFTLTGGHASILLGALPPIVHLQTESDKAALRWSLERMRQELREQRPGGNLVTQQLAHMMLVQALRLHLEGGGDGVGWMFALSDKQLSSAMNAMHENPAHRWTLQTLAERAGMSRTIFTLRFKETVGSSPMEYLTRWRMLLAGDRLQHTADAVSGIALSLGYESESAFSKAFKRVMGCSPRHYARGCNSSSDSLGSQETSSSNQLELVEA